MLPRNEALQALRLNFENQRRQVRGEHGLAERNLCGCYTHDHPRSAPYARAPQKQIPISSVKR